METPYIKFNAGVWNEDLLGRYDLGNYISASRTCDNFVPTRYGQVDKRPGTEYLGQAKYPDKKCRLEAFQFSITTKFMLEVGHEYIRFWNDDGTRLETSGQPVEVTTPYAEDEVPALQFAAIEDTVYITHPDHPLGKLVRVSATLWSYSVPGVQAFVDPPVNQYEVKLKVSGNSGVVTLTSGADAFTPDMVGSELELEYNIPSKTYGTSQHETHYPWKGFFEYFEGLNQDNDLNPFIADSFNPLSGYTLSAPNGPNRNRYYWDEFNTIAEYKKTYYATLKKTYPAPAYWAASTAYKKGDIVKTTLDNGSNTADQVLLCMYDHTSSSDLRTDAFDEKKWDIVTNFRLLTEYFDEGIIGTPEIKCDGKWSFKTSGLWSGEWIIERSEDGGATWETLKALTSREDSNYLVSEDQLGIPCRLRLRLSWRMNSEIGTEPVSLEVAENLSRKRVKIIGYTSPTEVDVRVIGELPGIEETQAWKISAFDDRSGYPRACAVFDNRLVLGGTRLQPQGFFYSGIYDYENFNPVSTEADQPFLIDTVSEDQSAVQWMSEQRELFVGTASEEGVLVTRKQDEAQSAENLPLVRWSDTMGSEHMEAITMRDSLLLVQRGGKQLNMMTYSIEADGYTGEEVSLMASDLFLTGIKQVAQLREPYNGLYVVTGDGNVAHMVYEPKLQVTGWCRFVTSPGSFESVQTLPGDALEDDVWVVVNRTINGSTMRCVEKFKTGQYDLVEDGATDGHWYVDSGLKITQASSATVTGLDHLEGEEVAAHYNDTYELKTVSSGSITLSEATTSVIVGLPVVSEFQPLDVESQWTAGSKKQMYQTRLRLWRSRGGQISTESKPYTDIPYPVQAGGDPDPVPLYDGWIEVFHESSHSREKSWKIKHEAPQPFSVQAVIQSFK